MGLMDAEEYDPRPAQRRKRLIVIAALIVVLAGILWFFFRFWPYERVINKLFEAVERNDMQTAYGVYMADSCSRMRRPCHIGRTNVLPRRQVELSKQRSAHGKPVSVERGEQLLG